MATQMNPRQMRGVNLLDLVGIAPVGGDLLDALFKQKGFNSRLYGGAENVWAQQQGVNESDVPLYGAAPTNEALKAFDGYTFDWTQGDKKAGALVGYDPTGQQIGSWQQAPDSGTKDFLDWAALAAAGFGGAGLAGFGPLAGALGGAGAAGADMGAGASLGVGGEGGAGLLAAEGAGTISGGAGLTAGGISGAGITAPTLGATAGLGAGLGTTGGGAATGSFWGGLAKAAIPAAISTGVQLIGANQAAKAQQAATNQANNLQKYVFDTTRADNMPALQARNSALQQMQALLSDPSTLTSQPGYQFGMDHGTKTLNNGAAARGMTYSGAQGKALQRFGQDYAGTKLDQSFNRLSSLASSGQTGAGTIANAAGNYGQQVGNNLTAMGDANAAKYIVGGNAIGNAVNGLTAYGQRQGWWGG